MFFPSTPPSLKKNKTLVLNQGSRCLYVCIYLDIYSVFCQAVCLPECIPEILKTYMAKPQRSKTCVLWALRSTLGQSLKWFIWKELNKSLTLHIVFWRMFWKGMEDHIPVGVLPLCWVRGLRLKPLYRSRTSVSSLGHLQSISTFYCWYFCYFFLPLKCRNWLFLHPPWIVLILPHRILKTAHWKYGFNFLILFLKYVISTI